MVYAGNTPACLSKVQCPAAADWYLNYSENHRSNEHTMIGYLRNILIPYVNVTRDSLKLNKTHPAIVIFDTFKSQTIL